MDARGEWRGDRVRGDRVPRVPEDVRGHRLHEPQRHLEHHGMPAELPQGRVRGHRRRQHGVRHGRRGREVTAPPPFLPKVSLLPLGSVSKFCSNRREQ